MAKTALENQYNTLIEEYQSLKLNEDNTLNRVLENHHILPTSLGGGNEPENMVMLTAAKHFEAHRLLAEMGSREMICAFWWMCKTMKTKGIEVTAEEYEIGRKLFIESGVSHTTRRKISEAGIGRVVSKETRAKISASSIGKKMSPEACAKMSKNAKERVMSDETKAKISALHMGHTYNLGRKHTPQSCANMGAAHTGNKNGMYDHTIYTFKHKDGGTFTGTRADLMIKHNLCAGHTSSVINGNRPHHKGWRLLKD